MSARPPSGAPGPSDAARDASPRVTAEHPDPLIGRIVADRYEILALIDAGGMGRIYRARQRSLAREVAVKFIHPHLLGSERAVARFMTEAQAASRLSHPNVVSVFDFGRADADDGGAFFLVMELLDGQDLGTIARSEGPLPFQRIAAVLGQTLDALDEAHRASITHRDVKPDNIMLVQRRPGRDLVKVIDFGIALTRDTRTTETGTFCGSPGYMAPEQASGGEIGPWSDIYAVGAVMFELLTGQPLFEGNTGAMLYQHVTSPRPDPRDVAPRRGIPEALASVCRKALAIDPAGRFGSAAAFAEALAQAGSGPPPPSARRWSSYSILNEGAISRRPTPRPREAARPTPEGGFAAVAPSSRRTSPLATTLPDLSAAGGSRRR